MTNAPLPPADAADSAGSPAAGARAAHRQEIARVALDSMTQFVGLLDAEGKVIEINRAALDAVGVNLSEVVGKPLWATLWWQVSRAGNAALREAIGRAVRGESVRWDAEIYGRDGGGKTVVIDALLTPIKDPHGRVEHLVLEGHDITERKAREREEADFLEVLTKVGATVAAEIDLERTVQVVTDVATELSGAAFGSFFYNVVDEKGETYTLYTLSGAPREAFAKFPMPRNTAVFGPTFRGDGTVRSDDITKDPRYGRNAPYHGMPKGHLPVRSYLAAPVKSRSGEVLGGLFFGHPGAGIFGERAERIVEAVAVQAGIAIDKARLYKAAQDEIARRRQVEAALRENEQNLESKVAERTEELDNIWKLSRDLMVVVDLRGRWVAVNPAVEQILGRSMAEYLGKTSDWILHPEDAERSRANVDALIAGTPQVAYENRLRHADGTYRWLSWTAVSNARHIFGTGRDVTAEKEAEKELARTQDALRQVQKMEAIGQLTGGIAHDFNNLLTIIIGNIDSLQRRLPPDVPDRLHRSARNALQGAQRAASLTQRLLAFSRRQPLNPRPLDCNKLVAGMGELLVRTLGESIRIETVLAGGLWRTEADANQLESALLNLAVNARDAMPDGGKLTIETANAYLDELYASRSPDVTSGEYVVIAVTDTGTGMTEEVMERAFEPFFTTKPIGQGTGLGLPQVYGFVKQSGGHVKAYSEIGGGTAVKIYLPRLIGEAGEEKEPPRVAIPGGRTGETVLVVEDEQLVSDYTGDVLSELGYRVLQASDGNAALALLERHRVDLLFTDIGLPGMNGRQLAEEACKRRPGLKTLFTTGYARNTAVGQGRPAPDVPMIGKPFTYADLAAKVREALDGLS